MDQMLGDDPVSNDLLVVVDVVDEQIQRFDALAQAGLDAGPLVVADDPRQYVERPDLLDPGLVAVDVEGNAHVAEVQLRGDLAVAELVERYAPKPLNEGAARVAGNFRGREHLIERFGVVHGALGPSKEQVRPANYRTRPARVQPSDAFLLVERAARADLRGTRTERPVAVSGRKRLRTGCVRCTS